MKKSRFFDAFGERSKKFKKKFVAFPCVSRIWSKKIKNNQKRSEKTIAFSEIAWYNITIKGQKTSDKYKGGDPVSTLASRIERYIKDMMAATERNYLELKRKDLAEVFSCVPSQINYVLETRFRDEQGYHVVSQRGAGGCFRIIRLEVTDDKELKELISTVSGSEMSYKTAEGFLGRLLEEAVIDRSEYMLIMSMIGKDTLAAAGDQEDKIRAVMMKNVLITLLRMDY